jgi:hypothetical protein
MKHGERIGRGRAWWSGAFWMRAPGVVLLGMAVWLAAASPVQAAAFGELVVLQGKAVVTRGGKPFMVHERAALEDGDRVDTLADSKARLVIGSADSGMEAILSSRTSLLVNQTQQGARYAAPISLVFGALRARVRSWTGQPFVATRAATVGIKGTDFVTWVKRPQASEFVGVEGLIECVSQTNQSYSIRIGQRQWGEIVDNEQPKAPIRVPDAVWNAVQTEFSFPPK